MYQQGSLSALDAISEAQRIAFAPMLFQAALCLRNMGVLTWLDKQGQHGATLENIIENSALNEYAASILLDMGLSGRIITHKEGYYYLTKFPCCEYAGRYPFTGRGGYLVDEPIPRLFLPGTNYHYAASY